MLEILRFIFSDVVYFLGTSVLLLIVAWGISNFTLVRINISNYHLVPGDLVDTEVNKNEEL